LKSVPCRGYGASFDHQHDRTLWSSRSVNYSLWHCETLLWGQFHRSILQIDEQPTFNDVEEFILVVMLVPVKLAFDDAKPHYTVIYLAQGLIEPILLTILVHLSDVNKLERTKPYFSVDRIG